MQVLVAEGMILTIGKGERDRSTIMMLTDPRRNDERRLRLLLTYLTDDVTPGLIAAFEQILELVRGECLYPSITPHEDLKEVDSFNKHLDECKQCNENPFDLCVVGRLLIERAGKVALAKVSSQGGSNGDDGAKACQFDKEDAGGCSQ